jgi:acyl carrier protein
MALTETEAFSAVQEAVVGALGVDEDEASPNATLMDDLGAESIDLLDILFRIERSTGVKVHAADLAEHIQGGLADDEFSDHEETVTEAGLAHLAAIMPQIDPAALAGRLEAQRVIDLFSVQNLVDLVTRRAALAST